MKIPRIKICKNRMLNKKQISLLMFTITMLGMMLVPAIIFSRTAAAPVLTQKIVLRDAEKVQRENVTVNQGETLSSCYIEITPANVTNKAVTLTSSNPSIMTVAQHKGADGRTYADITGIASGVATLTVTAQDTGITYSLSVSVAIPLEPAEAELKRALKPKKTAQDTAASFTTMCSAGQRGTIVGEVGDYYFFDIPKGVLEKNYHAAYVKKSDLKVYANALVLAPNTVILNKGQKQTLNATVTPSYATEKMVQYSTSNGAVVTISKAGIIKAKKKGSAAITATVVSKSNGQAINRTATVSVTVKQPIKKITIKPDRLTLEKGSSRQLKVIKSPSNADDAGLTYQSSNETVATVSLIGKVTAQKEGKTTITVANEASKKKKTCKITVVDTKSYKLIIDDELEAGKTYQVQVAKKDALKKQGQFNSSIVNPSIADEKLIFQSSNKAIAAIDKKSGKLTTYKAGTVTITMRPAGSKKTYKITVKVKKKTANQKKINIIMKKGDKAAIAENDQSQEEKTYKSSDKKIAVVNSKGEITAKRDGTCTIRIISKEKANERKIKLYVYKDLDKKEGFHYGFLTSTQTYSTNGAENDSNSLKAYTKVTLIGKCGKESYYATFYDNNRKKAEKGIISKKNMLLYGNQANRNYFLTAHKNKLKNLAYANAVEDLPDNHTPLQIGIVDDTVHIFVNFQYKGKGVNTCFGFKQGEKNVEYDETYREVFEKGLKEYWGNEGKIEYTGSNEEYSARHFNQAKHNYELLTYREKDFEEGVVLKCQVHINERCDIGSHYIPVTIGGKKGNDGNYWFWAGANGDDVFIKKKDMVQVYESYEPYGANKEIVIPTNRELEGNPSASKQGSYRMDVYKRYCAHEFGHMLGLDDAYKLEVDNAYEKTTIYRIESTMLSWYYDGFCMMDDNKSIFSRFRANDLEMVLYAYNNMQSNEKLKESWQPYRTYQYKVGKNKMRIYNRSKAITWREVK